MESGVETPATARTSKCSVSLAPLTDYTANCQQLHPLMQDQGELDVDKDGPEEISLRLSEIIDTSLFQSPDEELEPLITQLQRSLENMQGNHAQVDGLEEAMNTARVALDDVLFRHASAQQYAAM